jgi:brefeldin A-inhibited guanine nucleotide-exchange protein 3
VKLSANPSQDEASSSHLHALLDVFEVFLDTDNPLVFSNAAVDCILCLLKHVRGPSKFNFMKVLVQFTEYLHDNR